MSLHSVFLTLHDLALGVLGFALMAAAFWSAMWADRWAFRKQHGQAALDAFDADCSRLDDELDAAARSARAVATIPCPTHAERIRRRERHGGAA